MNLPARVREYFWRDPERYPEVVAMQTFIATVSQNPEDPPVVEPWAAYHYLHDALGSVVGLVDEAGFLVERYTYDPYENLVSRSWKMKRGLIP